MREIDKVRWDYMISMQEIASITQEVYGRQYDVQMGEMHNGSYLEANTKDTGTEWAAEWVDDDDWKSTSDISLAIDMWLATPVPERWSRPEWQPELWAVLGDLANKGEIPHGNYFVDVSW